MISSLFPDRKKGCRLSAVKAFRLYIDSDREKASCQESMFFTGSKGDLHNCAEEIYMLNYAVIRNSSRVRRLKRIFSQFAESIFRQARSDDERRGRFWETGIGY